MKKILIAVPTNKYIEVETFKSIYDLEIPNGYEVDFQYFYGYRIDQIRNLIADWVINKYDYLFAVDSDISFPPDTLKRLLRFDNDMVTGVYIQRIPGTHNLELYGGPDGRCERLTLETLGNDVSGMVEINGCGFGCVLIKKKVFQAISAPHFEYHVALDHNQTLSEDVDFCIKAKKAGFRIFADITVICNHHGAAIYRPNLENRPRTEIIQTPPKVESDVQARLRELANQRLLPKAHVDYLKHMKETYPNDIKVIYDIGSCVLHWTSEARRIWPDAFMVQFEAMKDVQFLYDELDPKKNLSFSGVLLGRDSGEQVDFWENVADPGGNSRYLESTEYSKDARLYFNESHKTTREVKTLSDIKKMNRDLPLPDLIKIDTQGSEMDILRGMSKDQWGHVKHLILELQTVEYNEGAPLAPEVISWLDDAGFRLVTQFTNAGPDGDYHFMRK